MDEVLELKNEEEKMGQTIILHLFPLGKDLLNIKLFQLLWPFVLLSCLSFCRSGFTS